MTSDFNWGKETLLLVSTQPPPPQPPAPPSLLRTQWDGTSDREREGRVGCVCLALCQREISVGVQIVTLGMPDRTIFKICESRVKNCKLSLLFTILYQCQSPRQIVTCHVSRVTVN